MSTDIYKINPEFRDIMPQDIIDLEDNATWGQDKRTIQDLTDKKELLEEHSLCAGCPEAAASKIYFDSTS